MTRQTSLLLKFRRCGSASSIIESTKSFHRSSWIIIVIVWEEEEEEEEAQSPAQQNRGGVVAAPAMAIMAEDDDSARPPSSHHHHHHHHHRRSSSGGSSSSSSSPPPAAAAAAEVVLPPHLKYSFVQFVNLPKTHVDHTYRDFSENLSDAIGSDHPNGMDDWWWTHDIPPPQPHDHGLTFHQRLYRLLSYTSSSSSSSSGNSNQHQYEQQQQPQLHHHHHHYTHNSSSSNNKKKTKDQTIVWLPHGRAFWIVDRVTFDSSGLLPQFFGYSSLRRFEAQLRHHGYKPLLHHQCPSSGGGGGAGSGGIGGTDSACYYSEVGLMHVCILYLVLLVSFVVSPLDLGFGICYFLLTPTTTQTRCLPVSLARTTAFAPVQSD
jgi:hypothetical protein